MPRTPRATAAAALALLIALLLATAAVAQAPPGEYPYFPGDAPWTQDITNAPVDAESAGVIADLSAHAIWTDPNAGSAPSRFQIDFGLEVIEMTAGNAVTSRDFTETDDFFPGDCDHQHVPLPAGGAVEASSSYDCGGYDAGDDCHLLVVDRTSHTLFEMWRATVTGPDIADFQGGCLAVWNLALTYPPEGRGQDCTSADAAGYPIAPLLFNADEVAAGHIDHAIRFVLPNSRIRHLVYVHPATHSTSATSGGPAAAPYGAHLRLRADYPLQNLPNEGARVIARALQKYGMYLSDGGNLALTGQSDQLTTAKWDDVLGPNARNGNPALALVALLPSDFEMVAGGTRYDYGDNCVRSTPLFNDGFEVASPFTTKWSAKTP